MANHAQVASRNAPQRRMGGFWVAEELLTVYGQLLGPCGIAVYCALVNQVSDTSLQLIASQTGMTPIQAQRELNKLEAMELVRITHRVDEPERLGCILISLKDRPAPRLPEES